MPATTTTMVRSIWQNYFYAMDGQEKAAAAEAEAAAAAEKAAVAEEVEDDPLEEDLQVGVVDACDSSGTLCDVCTSEVGEGVGMGRVKPPECF